MENFNGTLHGVRKEGSTGRGLLFAIIGMLLGIAACIVFIGILAWDFAFWLAGPILGGLISGGWWLGKGPSGATRQITMIILSIIGGILGTILAFAVILYNLGFGSTFAVAIDMTLEVVFDEFDLIFDVLITAAMAIGTAWRAIGQSAVLNSDDNDVEIFGEPTNQPSTRTEMEELLGEDIPTLRLDETWRCRGCGAENRNIVETCEYCGGAK